MENLRKTYLMRDRSTYYIKIGKSINVLYREKTLQAEKPTIEGLFYVEDDIEKLLHSLFSEKRLRGEWFNLNQEDIDFIDLILVQKGLIKKEFSLDNAIRPKKNKNKLQTIRKQENEISNYLSTKNAKPNEIIKVDNGFIINACYEMTALEKNIMYAVMSKIQDIDSPTRCYKISLTDISGYTKKRIHNDDFREAINKLLTRAFIIKNSDSILPANFISSAYYNDTGDVGIGIDLKIRPYLFALKKNFTIFGLEVAMSLKSKYAKRLYEMLCQFKSTGLMRVSIEELKARFQLVNTEGVEQYERWSSFEKKVLLIGQTEINEKAEFQFDYHLKKQGRKITAVEFIFRKPDIKPEPPPVITMPVAVSPQVQQANPRIVERLEKYGLNMEKINNILIKHSEKVINKQLYELDCNRETVKNTAAYLLKIFDV